MLRRRCARLCLPLIRRLPSAFAEYGGGARKNLGPAGRISFDAAIMLNLRENLPHSDEITSLYQVAAAPPQPTPIRRAAACGGVAPAARGPGAAAPSRACAGAGCRGAALAVRVCSRGRARCPPPGGLRAPLPAAPQSGAAAGSVVLRPLRRPRVPFRGGPGPPRRCPVAARCAPARPRAAALRSGRGRPRSARARLASLPPFPGLGRRFGRCGRCAACSLPCSRGAPPPVAASPGARAGAARCPPPAPCSRVSPPSWPAPRRSRSASPGACRRCAASAWGGPAVPGPRCGGARRSGGRGGRAGARCGGPRLGALARPPRGVGVPPLRRRFFRGCCGALLSRAARRGLASPALLSALPSAAASCALTAALLPRGLFAPPAHFVVQGEVESQGVTRSTTYSAGLLLDIQNKLRIRQNSYYYFAELFVDFVNRHCPALLVCSYQKSRWQIWTIRMRRRCCATF